MRLNSRVLSISNAWFTGELHIPTAYQSALYKFEMIINKTILIVLGIVIGIYLLYKLFFRTSKFDEDYQKVYNKVLTSEEYKVKGQYDK